MLGRRTWLVFLFLLLASNSKAASIYSMSGIWNHPDVEVCFAAKEKRRRHFETHELPIDSWPGANRHAVQNWVQKDFTSETTGIHFTGWLSCSETPNAEIVVFFGAGDERDLAGHSMVGPQLRADELSGYPRAHSYVWLHEQGINRGNVLHEFGHAAGLQHEHPRREAKKDENCFDERVGYGTPAGNQILGPYDASSVMNYCFLHSCLGYSAGLSRQDTELLRYLYSPTPHP